MQQVSVPEAPIISMFSTIQGMRHHVRTAYGDSLSTFGGCSTDTAVHGIGQGNGAGPAIWAVVSSPMLDMMRDRGHGTIFWSALSSKETRFAGYAFVDDTADVCHTVRTITETGVETARALQDAIDCWEGGIRATGGTIMPKKVIGT